MDRRDFAKVAAATAAAAVAAKVGVDAIEDEADATQHAPVEVNMSMPPKVQRPVSRVIVAERKLEGAGFPVRRPLPSAALRMMDPFVLVDEMGPIDWPAGQALGAPDHPHRGFETVSYVLEGGVAHADSLGNRGRLGPGDVQWMTAGSGIVHAELPPPELKRTGGRMHAFQIWVNLPRRLKMTAPRYQELVGKKFPEATSADGLATVRVVAGEALGVSAAIATHTPIVFQHWTLQPGASIEQPIGPNHNAGAYVFGGGGVFGADVRPVDDGQLALFGAGDTIAMAVDKAAKGPMDVLLLAGVPHDEPVVQYGPFVMSSMDEIRQAFADYRAGKMGSTPG